MRIGFYTNYSKETAEFAHEVGFTSLQLSAWPGSALDANTTTDAELAEIRRDLDSKNIQISALGYYPNYLHPDDHEREAAQAYLPKVMNLASRLGVEVVATFAGQDPRLNVEENIPAFKELFSRYCDLAEKSNVKIALENCPMINVVTMKGNNIAYSPEIWDVIFDVVPSDRLGLEFDPSHLVWQGIDYCQAIKDYASKVFHVHAKDMEIDRKILARSGILGRSFAPKKGLDRRWWRARAPGWGEVDWPEFISAVIVSGYQGNLDIEHEDDVFASMQTIHSIRSEADVVSNYSQERAGLRLGYNTLSKLIVT
ncbi:sugar phosphate isomerase/epimerase [Rhizobium sp. K102]|uniref:sugar phosphate isomerase/epimerase family protein n=1 Tax=Rhizobium sp. K102 TaxID=2918527 RepID=UPI001EFA60E3|nr:sugar phosphate isomerase/epimerase [Rhizobium sp. K102]ULR46962.1 sugar phosphate isomerase/epimerase [Rhizobium sp. K102]